MLDRRKWKDKTEKWLRGSKRFRMQCCLRPIGPRFEREYRIVHVRRMVRGKRTKNEAAFTGWHQTEKAAIDKAYRKAGGK